MIRITVRHWGGNQRLKRVMKKSYTEVCKHILAYINRLSVGGGYACCKHSWINNIQSKMG